MKAVDVVAWVLPQLVKMTKVQREGRKPRVGINKPKKETQQMSEGHTNKT